MALLDPAQETTDLALGEEEGRERLLPACQRRVALQAERAHGLGIPIHTDLLERHVRELGQHLAERQTCRLAAASEI